MPDPRQSNSAETLPGVGFSGLLSGKHQIGDVFQIIEKHGRKGWIGAFVLATEIKHWGIQGFVTHIVTHDEQRQAFIRLPWDEIEFIGHAPLIPGDDAG